jgi:26S proteasome regulatory subunit N3
MADHKKDKEKDNKDKEKTEKKEEPKKIPLTPLQSLRNDILVLEKALINKDVYQIIKITRSVRRYKKKLHSGHIKIINDTFHEGSTHNFAGYSDFKEVTEQFDVNKSQATRLSKILEVEIYLGALLLIHLVKVRDLNHAKQLAESLITKFLDSYKRHLCPLATIIYFYLSRIYELSGNLKDIRSKLFELYRIACVKKDEISQATLLNLLLRNYLAYKNYEAAQQLISKTTFPENKSNAEYIRYLYYTGKIKAVQLEYGDAYSRLMQAIRKAPESSAIGFRIHAIKLATVVELLMGEIPNRNTFFQPDIAKHLQPYYRLVQTVIKGNLESFKAIVQTHQKLFEKDDLLSLIQRLHRNVIKTGLKRISLSYSKISLADIAQKLRLENPQDVELVVAKAIRDGVLSAVINHESQSVVMKGRDDVYATQQPELAFKKRLEFCLNLYNSTTKALQYPQELPISYEIEKTEMSPEELIKMVEEDFDF